MGSQQAFGGEIYDLHELSGDRKSQNVGEVEPRILGIPESAKHGITEIGIERTGCFGTCPIYTFIVKSDGTFRYKGFMYVEREGEFTGTIHVGYFHQLARFVKESGYMELKDRYARPVTDNATIYTMVVMNGQRKTVGNYASGGPAKLWAIEQLIDSLMSKAKWDRSQKAPGKK